MQIAAEAAKFHSLSSVTLSEFSVTVRQSQSSQYRVIRCNGAVASFEPFEMPVVVTKVFLAVDRMQGAASAGLQPQVSDDAMSKPTGSGCQAGNACSSWDPLIGPIG